MGLLSINRLIQQLLVEGKSREEIFIQLSKQNPENMVKFAYCLAATPNADARRRFLKLNAVLFLLLPLLAALSVAVEWPVDFQQSTFFLALKFIVPLIFAYFVFQFHGGIYRILGLWCFVELLESLLLLSFGTAAGLAKTFVLLLIVSFAFLIARKVFPHLGFLGPKQDNQGRYLL